jgi:adenylate cyclase
MPQLLPEKIKKSGVTVRFTILSIFITLFSLGMLILIGLTYQRMSENVNFTSINLIKQVSKTVYKEIVDTQMHSAQILSETLAVLISQGLVDVDHLDTYLPLTYTLLKNHTLPLVEEIEWGDIKGNAYLQEKHHDGTVLTEVILYPGMITTQFRDKNEQIIKVEKKQIVYDPRNRPWYLVAKKATKFVWTHLFNYRLASYGLLGVGAVTPVYYKDGSFHGVVFIGVRMDYFGQVIKNIPISEHDTINIMTDDGKLFATNHTKTQQGLSQQAVDVHSLSIPGLAKSFDHYLATGETDFTFKEHGEEYVANYNKTPQNWLIAIIVPESDFIGPLKKANLITIGFGFLILVLGIIIISRSVNSIVRPLRAIADETEEIKKFKLEPTKPIVSYIKEVARIANAIHNMKNGLRSFQKYIPATLVRQLIEKGEDAKIGGNKQQLSILFSDIAHFTTIAEQISPNELMQHLCNYLDELSRIIAEERGTIDKYIGDSIMAFWGAPLLEEFPCYQAARAALRCTAQLRILNKQWEAENLPTLQTRFGIHFGEAIIGNLGSSERLSYTAIGDSINLASRLEGTNKFYGTQIIVSESIYQTIKDQFAFRMVDCVILKGKNETTTIYELLAENASELSFDLEKYSSHFSQAFTHYQQRSWDKAINHFSTCIEIFPEDTLAVVFIYRCDLFKLTPPPKEWQGAWQLLDK